MATHALEQSSESAYLVTVDRTDEMARLQAQAEQRKSMLVFGPETVGKTRLIDQFVQGQKFALYVRHIQSPRDLASDLLNELRRLKLKGIRLPADPKALSTASLKGYVQAALDQAPFMLVLDHLAGPSRVVTGMVKELHYYGRTPIIFAARTPHMEDIGTLLPMCCNRSERLEMKNFSPPIALEFARKEARRSDLCASNLDSTLHFLAEKSEGNPGSIIHMIKMAHYPRYQVDDQIKAHVLYLDYRMGRRD